MACNVESKVVEHAARLIQANCLDDKAPVYETCHDGTGQMNIGELLTCGFILKSQ